jgi:tetratricopeptide (TPR) repeat protein
LIPEEDLTAKTAKVAKEDQKESLRSLRALRFNSFTQHDLLNRAADYFAQARKPRAEWKNLDDLVAQLAEFDLRCATGDYDTAASVLRGIDDLMQQWGHYRLTMQINELILSRIKDNDLVMFSLGELGWAYLTLGEIHKARDYYQQGLDTALRVKSRSDEGIFLGSLGSTHMALGNLRMAIQYYEQALVIAREVGDHFSEGNRLGNLGIVHNLLGESKKAVIYLEQALMFSRETTDKQREVLSLQNLGISYAEEEHKKAEENYKQAIKIADEISFSVAQQNTRSGLAESYLFENDLVNSRATIEAALQYDDPQNNHNATGLHGIIALRQGEMKTAQEAFTKSIAQADEILAKTPEYYSALDAKGLALCGVALCADDGPSTVDRGKMIDEAIEIFRAARVIAPHAGIVKATLRLFDELAKCDPKGLLAGVRAAVEGK